MMTTDTKNTPITTDAGTGDGDDDEGMMHVVFKETGHALCGLPIPWSDDALCDPAGLLICPHCDFKARQMELY